MLAIRILFCSCLCKVRSQISDALSQALCNLSLAFLADSDSTALIHFHSFLSQITLCFSFGSKDMITAFHVFRLTPGTAALHCEHTFVGSRHTYCQWPIIELAMNVSPENKTAASHVIQIHTHAHFPWSENG